MTPATRGALAPREISERALVSDQCTRDPTRGREEIHVLEIRDLTDLESMYHAPGCQCSEACRALTLKEKTMDRDEGLKVLSPSD